MYNFLDTTSCHFVTGKLNRSYIYCVLIISKKRNFEINNFYLNHYNNLKNDFFVLYEKKKNLPNGIINNLKIVY